VEGWEFLGQVGLDRVLAGTLPLSSTRRVTKPNTTELVPPAWIEQAAHSLGNCCSIQLSYGGVHRSTHLRGSVAAHCVDYSPMG
jgi:hypothetical protein